MSTSTVTLSKKELVDALAKVGHRVLLGKYRLTGELVIEPIPEFKREDRYYILKKKDVERFLGYDKMAQLINDIVEINIYRQGEGKKPLTCVVVEEDWPEYEHVWALIESRVTGG